MVFNSTKLVNIFRFSNIFELIFYNNSLFFIYRERTKNASPAQGKGGVFLKCYNDNVSVTFCHAYCFITFLALSLLTLTR